MLRRRRIAIFVTFWVAVLFVLNAYLGKLRHEGDNGYKSLKDRFETLPLKNVEVDEGGQEVDDDFPLDVSGDHDNEVVDALKLMEEINDPKEKREFVRNVI